MFLCQKPPKTCTLVTRIRNKRWRNNRRQERWRDNGRNQRWWNNWGRKKRRRNNCLRAFSFRVTSDLAIMASFTGIGISNVITRRAGTDDVRFVAANWLNH